MSTSLTPLLALVRKDLRLYFSNRRALLMSIVAPIVIAAFFGSVFGGKRGDNARIEIAVTDLDRSEMSQQIVTALRTDKAFDVIELPEAEAVALVRSGKRMAAVVLPAGLGAQVPRALFNSQLRPEITLHFDPSQSMALQVVEGLLAQHTMSSLGASVLGGQTSLVRDARQQVQGNPNLAPERRSELLALFDSIDRVQAGQGAASAPASSSSAASGAAAASAPGGFKLELPYTLRAEEARSLNAAKYNGYAHAFAGMGVQFILFAGIDLGIGLLSMRRTGLWLRLRAAPLSKAMLLGSRILSTAVIAAVLMTLMFAAAIGLFGVRIDGSWLGMVGVVAAFSLLTASLGLLVAALGRTPEATRGLAIFVTLVMVMLGGAWVPAFVFPQWLQTVSLFVPTRWAVDGLDAMTWRGLGLDAALAPIGAMLAFTAVFALIAWARFGWEE